MNRPLPPAEQDYEPVTTLTGLSPENYPTTPFALGGYGGISSWSSYSRKYPLGRGDYEVPIEALIAEEGLSIVEGCL